MWNRGFLTVALSYLVSRSGTVVYDVVLAWWLVERTGATVVSGYVLAASTLPLALFSPLSGVLVDRWNTKRVLVVTDVASCLVVLVVAVMASRDIVNVPALIACSVLLGANSSLGKPASRSMVPALVAREHLTKANSLTTGFGSTTAIIGPLLGAALMALPGVGIAGALYFNALSFGISAAAQSTISFRPAATAGAGERVRDGLRVGLAYVARRPSVRALLLLCGAANFFLVSFTILLPLYVSDVLHRGSGTYSSVVSAEALGGVAVTVCFLARRSFDPRPAMLAWFIVASGASLSLIPLFPAVPVLLSLSFVEGALMGAFNTLFFTYIQQTVAAELLGRVFSLVYMTALGVMPVAYFLFGSLGRGIVDLAFLYTGIGSMLVSLPFLRIRHRAEAPAG